MQHSRLARIFRGLSRQIETVGIEAIPECERRMSPWRYFLVWFMASSSATTPLIGHLLFPLGLQDMLLAMVCALLWGVLPAGLVTLMGRKAPLSALVIARRPFGNHGAMFLSALFTMINVVWFGLNSEVAGELLSASLPGGKTTWVALVGVIQTVLVLFGMHLLQAIYQITFWFLLVVLGGLACVLAMSPGLTWRAMQSVPASGIQSMPFAEGVAVILNFSLFAWTYKLSTVSRFCRPQGAMAGYFMAAPVGIMISMALMAMLGFMAELATGSWNPGLLVVHWPIMGPVVACLLGLTIIQTNALNLYPSTIDALVCVRTFRPAQWWQEPMATVTLGLLATAAALGGILSRISGLLAWVEHLVIPFTCILLLDWYGFGGHRLPVDTYLCYDNPRYHTAGCLAFVLSVVASLALHGQLPYHFQAWLPQPVAVFMLTAIIYIFANYLIGSKVRPERAT